MQPFREDTRPYLVWSMHRLHSSPNAQVSLDQAQGSDQRMTRGVRAWKERGTIMKRLIDEGSRLTVGLLSNVIWVPWTP